MNKFKKETILNNLIDNVETYLDNEDKLKEIYYQTIDVCKNTFGVVDKRYYKKWLTDDDYNQYIRLKQQCGVCKKEFEKFKKYLSYNYFNGTIKTRIHQTKNKYLTVHHINEIEDNIPTNLSDWKYNTKDYWCYHFKYNLVYCDLMFHYFIHLIIMRIKNEYGTNLYDLTSEIFKGIDKDIKLYKYITNTYCISTNEKLYKIYQKIKEKTWQNQKNMI